jgi:hypothetical protein
MLDAHNIQRWLGVPIATEAELRTPIRKVHAVKARRRR